MSLALCLISDASWITQARHLHRQIRQLGYSGRICLLLLEPVPDVHGLALSDCGLDISVADANFCSSSLAKSGLKMWLPQFFRADSYILVDSDLILLSEDFLRAFLPVSGKLKLVRESFLVWRAGKKKVAIENHANIIGQPLLQTGVMSFTRDFWQTYFCEFTTRIATDPSEFGDMVALNQFIADYPYLLEAVPEEACLVLRPTGKGASTRAHLPMTRFVNGRFRYDGREVLSIHYTSSNGQVCTCDHIMEMITRYDTATRIAPA